MSQPFLGMLGTFGFNFAPRGWALCQGQTLAIAQNTALFALLGTQYGGNGQTTFQLPDLRGRVPNGQGAGPGLSSYQIGQAAGTENTTLTTNNMPQHTHAATFNGGTSTLNANNVKGTVQAPVSGYQLARPIDGDGDPNAVPWIYAPAAATNQVPLGGLNVAGTVTNAVAGSSQPFAILDPYLTVNWSIALQGIFPSRN